MREDKPKYKLFDRVRVIELDAAGYVYESGVGLLLGHRVYGVKLDEVAFPKNFVATIVWHCESEGLEAL